MSMDGLFKQLNAAVGTHALAQPTDESVDGMPTNPMDKVNPLLQQAIGSAGSMMGADPMSTMTSKQMLQQSNQEMAKAFISDNPETMKQTAQKLMAMGRQAEAMKLIERAEQIEQAKQAKQNAQLTVMGEQATEEAERKRNMQQKSQAIAMAKRDKNFDMVEMLENGSIEPSAYYQAKMEKKKLYELSKGEMLTDENGNVIRVNPDLTGSGENFKPSVASEKQWDALTTASYDASAKADQMQGLSEKIAKTPDWSAGMFSTAEEFMLGALGKRDNPQYLRTEAIRLKNHAAIQSLPKGPASDRDIAIVMQGFPQGNAGKEEITEWLNATARVTRKAAEYDKMKADYIIRGKRKDFDKDWEVKMEREGQSERIQATPKGAIEEVMANPALRDDFLIRYGWVPEMPNG